VPPITVVIADSDARRRSACVRLLQGVRGITILATLGTVRETIGIAAHHPHILLLDLKLARANDAATLPVLRTKSPRTQIILLTGQASDAQVLAGIAQGARGYLDGKLLRRFLVKAVRAVAAGESWISRAMVGKLIDQLARLMAQGGRARRA
jgi:DNA-binding NarL/FixJ family response regulator